MGKHRMKRSPEQRAAISESMKRTWEKRRADELAMDEYRRRITSSLTERWQRINFVLKVLKARE